MGAHPSLDEIADAAAGDPEARRRLALHLRECTYCREQLSEFLGVLAAAADEIALGRPGCPDPELLVELPPGGEADDPHVRSCPLCREELALNRRLQTQWMVESAFAGGPPVRPDAVTSAQRAWLQAGPGQRAELQLTGEATVEAEVGGTTVCLSVAAGRLEVKIAEEPQRPLELVLENELLVQRVPLRRGRHIEPVGTWLKAQVRLMTEEER